MTVIALSFAASERNCRPCAHSVHRDNMSFAIEHCTRIAPRSTPCVLPALATTTAITVSSYAIVLQMQGEGTLPRK